MRTARRVGAMQASAQHRTVDNATAAASTQRIEMHLGQTVGRETKPQYGINTSTRSHLHERALEDDVRTGSGRAPSATRTPISRVRLATAKDVTAYTLASDDINVRPSGRAAARTRTTFLHTAQRFRVDLAQMHREDKQTVTRDRALHSCLDRKLTALSPVEEITPREQYLVRLFEAQDVCKASVGY